MGIVALSVLVYDRTGSAFATAVLFLGTGFLPAILAPILVARVERPPPRFVLPVLYAGEAAAFAGLVLFSGHFSLAAVFVLATVDGALALSARALTRAVAAAMLEPAGELRAGNAILNVAFTGGAAVGPAIAGLGCRRLRDRSRPAAGRRLLLRDRLDPAHGRSAPPGDTGRREHARAPAGWARLCLAGIRACGA